MAEGFQLDFESAGGRTTRTFSQDRVLLGRSIVCDLVLDSPHLSRKHAEIVRDGDGWAIRDLRSRHGVAVNGDAILDRRLAPGDRIALAPKSAEPTVLEFRLPDRADAAAPQLSFGEDPSATRVLASIDLREMAKTLSQSAQARVASLESRPVEPPQPPSRAAERAAIGLSPQLTALGLLKSAGEQLLACESSDEMLQAMADLIIVHFPGRRTAICTIDPAAGEIVPRCFGRETGSSPSTVAEPAAPRPFPISRSILQEAVRARKALLVASAADDPRFVAAVSIRQIGIRSAICVPLYHEGRVEGAVYVDSQRQSAALSGAELEVLTVLGLMLAAGIVQIALRGDVARERAIRERLARYNSPQVVEKIMRLAPRADEMLADEYDVSVLFADLSGFTALAESWPAAESVRVLNAIFERWTADVFARDGTLDKYIGDAVMAVFGAPLRQADHAVRAVATALAMQQSLAEFNRRRSEGPALAVRIGINSGRVIAGDIGSPLHRAYTAIGDAVNVASRLETSVAQPGEIVIGPDTFQQLEGRFACQPLGPMQLRGKRQAVEAYRVLRVVDGT